MILKLIKIHSYEAGLYFRNGEFRGLLDAGWHWWPRWCWCWPRWGSVEC